MMVSSRCSPIEIANCGMPCRKLVVPSSGSTIHGGPAFLAEEAVAGTRLGEVGIEHLLGSFVGERDEVRRSFQRHLQMLDLAKIAFQAAAGAGRGLDHDVDEG